MKLIFQTTIFISLFLVLSATASAEPPEGKGWNKHIEKREINTNRQSNEDSLRGLERAQQRHEMERKRERYQDGLEIYEEQEGRLKLKKHDKKSRHKKGKHSENEDNRYGEHYKKMKKEKSGEKEYPRNYDMEKKNRNPNQIERQGNEQEGRSWWKFWQPQE